MIICHKYQITTMFDLQVYVKNGSDYFKLFSKYTFFPDFVVDVDFAIVDQYVDYIKEILEYYI